jgi:hypothetical protein
LLPLNLLQEGLSGRIQAEAMEFAFDGLFFRFRSAHFEAFAKARDFFFASAATANFGTA